MSHPRLAVGVLGLRNAGKSHTWNTLFGQKVRTGSHRLYLRSGEYVDTFLIFGSPQERDKNVEDILKNQRHKIVLCSMQYIEGVQKTLDYFVDNRFFLYMQWLNPARGRYPARAFDDLGLTSRILAARSLLSIRNGDKRAESRVKELREFIYGWARYHGLLCHVH